MKWYRKAAEQGYAFAQSQLGEMYAKGEGVERDYVKAYAWSSLAAALVGEEAITARGLGREGEETTLKPWLRKQMTPAQIAEAQKLAAELWERIESSKSK